MDALDEEIRVELPLDSLKDKVDVVLPPEPPQLNDFQDNLSVHARRVRFSNASGDFSTPSIVARELVEERNTRAGANACASA